MSALSLPGKRQELSECHVANLLRKKSEQNAVVCRSVFLVENVEVTVLGCDDCLGRRVGRFENFSSSDFVHGLDNGIRIYNFTFFKTASLSVNSRRGPKGAVCKCPQTEDAAEKCAVKVSHVGALNAPVVQFFKKSQLRRVREQKCQHDQCETYHKTYNCSLQRDCIDRCSHLVERSKNTRCRTAVQKSKDFESFDRDVNHRFVSLDFLLIHKIASHLHPRLNLKAILA